MKILYLSLLCLVLCVARAEAQAQLSVFKVNGAVTAVADGGETALKPRDVVGIQTVVNIPEGGSVAILNKDTKQIFRSLTTGRIKVANILKEARRQSDASVRRTAEEIGRDVSDGSGGRKSRPQGAAMRDVSEGAVSVERIIAYALLAGRECSESPVSFTRRYDSDSTYVFEIHSTCPEPVFVNLADVSSPSRSLLFDVRYSEGEPFVTVGQGTTVIEAFRFYGGEERPLILIASNSPFDVQAVQVMLRKEHAQAAQTAIPDGLQLWLTTVR